MDIKKLLHIITFCLLLFACEEDSKISTKHSNPSLVINSLIGTDSILRAKIYSSSYFGTQQKPTVISNAKATIFENNKEIGELTYKNESYSLNNYKITANSTYRMSVSHPNFPLATTQCKTLKKVPISKVSSEIYPEKNRISFTVTFNDPKEEKNYYMILLYGNDSFSRQRLQYYSENIAYQGNLQLNSDSRILSRLYKSITFSDQTFTNQKASITIYRFLNDQNEDLFNYKIVLYHITEEYFNYERSYVAIKNSSDIPFLHQSNLFSNVKSGYGIFASYATDEKEVQVNK
jgi:hypothetical protein